MRTKDDGPSYIPVNSGLTPRTTPVLVPGILTSKTEDLSLVGGTLTYKSEDLSLVGQRNISPMQNLAPLDAGQGMEDIIASSPFMVGFAEDRQRSRKRFINRNIPPFQRNIAQFGRRSVPRRWR